MKKWLSLLLALAMLLSLLPTVSAAPAEQAPERDIWEVISEIEDAVDAEAKDATAEQRAVGYGRKVDEIIDAVTSSSSFVPGSLERHGSFFFWMDTDGNPNGYSPSLRARQRAGAVPGAEPEDFAATEVVSYAARGGYAGSLDIAAFQPYIGIDSSFTAQYENRCKSLAQATGGIGTTYKTNNANINNIGLALSTCGVVIFDSHGTTDYDNGSYSNPDYTSRANTSYLCLTTGTGITAQDKQSAVGPFGTYYHAFQSGTTWCIDGTAMANHMTTDSPNGMLWMAICLGMATDGLQAPLRGKGLEVVYGYSQSVTFAGDYAWEGKFWPKMISGSNVKDAIAYMKQQVGNNDPYENDLPAWPIVASSEDPYPGQGNVDKAQTVYSTWTLYPQYTVTVYANNDQWGSVRLNGDTINAVPADGYYTAGAEVVSGTAALTQNGNTFTVTPESDCEIRVDFAEKTPAALHFSTPEGVSCEDVVTYVGDEVTLPTPQQMPVVEGRTFKFLGWAMDPVTEDTMTLPVFLKDGTKMKVTEPDMTLYALYSYFVAANGLQEDQFLQVDHAPASWEGEYVITWQGKKALNASGSAASTAIGGSAGVVDLEKVGAYVENRVLNGVTDDLIFVVTPSNNGSYTIKMKTKNYFLALASDADGLTTYTSSNTDKTRWNLSFENGSPVWKNAAYPGRALRYITGSGVFKATSGSGDALMLFTRSDGDLWYTTDPRERTECEIHTYGEWITEAAPTCLEPGTAYRICEVCGHREDKAVPALGHDYKDEVTAPTCTEPGFTTHTCARCGDTFTDTQVPALGHDYKDEVTAPTCTEPGFTTHTCARCGDTFTDSETPALGHDYQEGVCTRCGQEDPDYVALTAPVVTASNVVSTGKIKLTWTLVEGADSYTVYRATKADGSWKALKTVSKDNFTNTGAVAGNTYYYKVTAVRNGQEGPASAVVSATCLLARPVVTGTHVASTGKNKLTWEAVPGAASYLVLRATEKDGEYKELKNTENTSFTNTGAKAGVTYYYMIQAIAAKPEANSARSAVKTLTCDLPRPVVSIQLTSAGKPKLSWNAIEGAVKYQIYRSAAADGPFKLMKTTENTTYTNTKFDAATTYYYKVKAIHEKTAANSAYSTVVSITTK